MYSFLLDHSNGQKRTKDVNKNVVATRKHNEYKDVSLNKKCTNKKNPKEYHRIGTFKLKKKFFNMLR